MKKLLINLLLFIVSISLFFPFTIINIIIVLLVGRKTFLKTLSNYFYSTALNIDKFANREFRTLWNYTLVSQNKRKNNDYYEFGLIHQTISYCLGKNKQNNSLSKVGKALCDILNFFDKNHVEKTVELTEKEITK